MNLLHKFFSVLMIALFLGGSAGAAYYVKNGGLQGSIASHAARLQQNQSDLEFHLTDLSRLQQSLGDLTPARRSSEEGLVLRERIFNEQAVIQSKILKIVEDSGFLRDHWSTLTPQQKDLVDSVQKSRT